MINCVMSRDARTHAMIYDKYEKIHTKIAQSLTCSKLQPIHEQVQNCLYLSVPLAGCAKSWALVHPAQSAIV